MILSQKNIPPPKKKKKNRPFFFWGGGVKLNAHIIPNCKCADDSNSEECLVGQYCWTDNTCNTEAKPGTYSYFWFEPGVVGRTGKTGVWDF